MCCAVVTGRLPSSYQPRPLDPPSWKFSCSSTVPPPGIPPPVPPPDDAPVVAPVVMLDSPPNTAFRFSVPRYATSSKLQVVPGVSPSTVQLRLAPMLV